ncbi:MAG: hypothetical protein JF606_15220 [Burkholderiales bacterium]|nr:hypothetical protein [Burkholderiales bacterium]
MGQKTYTIRCTVSCDACQGSGRVTNPVWQRFFVETRDQKDPDEEAWARANGLSSAVEIGHEEDWCNACEGDGQVVRDVSLWDALTDLGVTLRVRN